MIRLFTAACLLLPAAAPAVTLSTMSLADAGHDLVTWNTWKGQSFLLSADAVSSRVISVDLRLEIIVPNATFMVRVVGNIEGSNRPDMSDVRAELRPAGLPAGTTVANVTFEADPQANFPPLEANGTYWIIAGMTAPDYDQASPAGVVRWHFGSTSGQDAGAEAGWLAGSQIAYSDTEGGDWFSSPAEPYHFSITAEPVPEPGIALLGIPAAVLLLNRLRFRGS